MIEEGDHIALHLDTAPPKPTGAPGFQAVDDAGLPSPDLFFESSSASRKEVETPIVSFEIDEGQIENHNDEFTTFR